MHFQLGDVGHSASVRHVREQRPPSLSARMHSPEAHCSVAVQASANLRGPTGPAWIGGASELHAASTSETTTAKKSERRALMIRLPRSACIPAAKDIGRRSRGRTASQRRCIRRSRNIRPAPRKKSRPSTIRTTSRTRSTCSWSWSSSSRRARNTARRTIGTCRAAAHRCTYPKSNSRSPTRTTTDRAANTRSRHPRTSVRRTCPPWASRCPARASRCRARPAEESPQRPTRSSRLQDRAARRRHRRCRRSSSEPIRQSR